MRKVNSIEMCNSPNLYATNTIVSEYINKVVCVCMCTQSCPTLCDPQTPLCMGSSGKEYWSGFPFPTAGDLPEPGIKPTSLVSPALADEYFTAVPHRKSINKVACVLTRFIHV